MLPDRGRCRHKPLMAALIKAAKEYNEKLKKANQPPLVDEELFAANLYTGPVLALTHRPCLLPRRSVPTTHPLTSSHARTADVRQVQCRSQGAAVRKPLPQEHDGAALLPQGRRRAVHGHRRDLPARRRHALLRAGQELAQQVHDDAARHQQRDHQARQAHQSHQGALALVARFPCISPAAACPLMRPLLAW